MKGNELIEKILNKEIRPGTMIKMKSNYPGLEWEKELSFNGNWFSEGKYEPGCRRYDDIILHLCDKYTTFEIIEEHKIPDKINQWDRKWHYTYYKKEQINQIQDNIEQLRQKYNKIIDYLEEIE